ncbi:MAG: hypothetical protein JHD35_02755 [Sphingopyxis sp.]|nr:hypothetical protein [Sphingopyxis sp.]
MPQTAKTGEIFESIGADRLGVILWLGFVAVSVTIHHEAITSLTFWDPDNAMRLAQVRDLSAGQGWFDTVQHRVNPAGGGGLMHWSRFIDAQIVGLIRLLSLFLEPETAERWTLALYPPLLVLPLLLVFARILRILGDQSLVLVGLGIAATTISFLHFFAPLNIDHHNWQLLLAVILLWLAIKPAHFSVGLLAALVASAYVEISLEGLPILAFFWALFAFDWLRDQDKAVRLAGFSAGLIAFPAFWLLVFRGPAYVSTLYCDSFSLPYLAPVALGGMLFTAFLAGPSRWAASRACRLGVIVVVGTAGAVSFILIAPSCLDGPFAGMEPLVRTYWYDPIFEGRPVWRQDASMAALYVPPTIVGLAAAAWTCWRTHNSAEGENWARLGILICFSTVLAMLVIRTTAIAHAFMVPAFAALAIALWRWSRSRSQPLARIGGALLFMMAIPIVDTAIGMRLAALHAQAQSSVRDDQDPCDLSRMTSAFAEQPPALVFSSMHIGPALLVDTPHSVVATGHHRSHAAIDRIISAFLSPPAAAHSIVAADGARYLAFCRKEIGRLAADSPRGLAAHLLEGRRIDWLQPEPGLSYGAFRVYRIVQPNGKVAASTQNSQSR